MDCGCGSLRLYEGKSHKHLNKCDKIKMLLCAAAGTIISMCRVYRIVWDCAEKWQHYQTYLH
jgi:hypothetical protein